MGKPLLSKNQRVFLQALASQSYLPNQYYLTGGTALAGYYIPYRYSEDLDFFSEREIDISAITAFIKKVQKELLFTTFDINSSFNRNLVQLVFPHEILKVEFTYYPFPPIKTPTLHDGIRIDSLLDIAVNKLFTIYQKPRSRDFVDLYMICKKEKYSIEQLLKLAKVKFDWHVDPIKLGSQFLLAQELKDYPRLLKPMNEKMWIGFFVHEAKRLGLKILV